MDYTYFKQNYKLIVIDLSKKQEFDGDPKTMQQINFTGKPERGGHTKILFLIKEGVKEIILSFSQGTMGVFYTFLQSYFGIRIE